VLTLPEHYRERAAIAHVAALDAAGRGPHADPAASGRDPMFGYGALYHPWLHASEPDGPAALRLLPPDGAAAGVIAGRATRRGAWVAPANEPLRDVVALEPAIVTGARQALQDAQVNLVRQEPGGFLWLAADTLGDDDAVRSIGVRRLLQTVRRLALRHGDAMAFEVDDDVVRRAVRRSFDALLGRMFELGAFAGRTPDEGFRVDTPVAAGDLEQARLVVELRVAPSHPLSFLTVRLVRSGAGSLHVEVR
jgi:phage tail sheath protein FI